MKGNGKRAVPFFACGDLDTSAVAGVFVKGDRVSAVRRMYRDHPQQRRICNPAQFLKIIVKS
jgi:hypothetical protein